MAVTIHQMMSLFMDDEANTLSEIIPGKLYLGNWQVALNLPSHIKHVVNMTPFIPNFHSWYSKNIIYFSCPIYDVPESNIVQHFDDIYHFIEEVAKDCPVLVHCVRGASRSVSVVIAYLMKKNNWDVETALTYVKERRSVANPNIGFLQQLHIYHTKLNQNIKN
jgi:protein-tyrosine phosphatase